MWLSSCFGWGVAPFVLPCVGLLSQLRVRLVFRVVVHEGLTARQGGSLREITLRKLPVVKGLGKFGVKGLMFNGGGVAGVSTSCLALLGPFIFFAFPLRGYRCCCNYIRCPCRRSSRCGFPPVVFCNGVCGCFLCAFPRICRLGCSFCGCRGCRSRRFLCRFLFFCILRNLGCGLCSRKCGCDFLCCRCFCL